MGKKEKLGMYIVIYGNILMGYSHWGPFASQDKANSYVAELGLNPADVTVARVYQPMPTIASIT
jgi:hypothetical protein